MLTPFTENVVGPLIDPLLIPIPLMVLEVFVAIIFPHVITPEILPVFNVTPPIVDVVVALTVIDPAVTTLPPIPAPPETTRAPVVELDELVVELIFTPKFVIAATLPLFVPKKRLPELLFKIVIS
jgi:hypothetical protein